MYVKGFCTIVWTDHKNNTFADVLKGNKRINKNITNLALEIEDIPHQKILRRGLDMILADSPSRWASHVGKATDLIRDLPLPALSIREIIRKLFQALDEFEQLISQFDAQRRQQTRLGLPAPRAQGLCVGFNLYRGPLTAVIK